MEMIIFSSMTFRERVLRLWPPYARRQDSQLEEAIYKIVKNPDMKCNFDCNFTPEMFTGVALGTDGSSSSIESFE
jgi:hypothetical protein